MTKRSRVAASPEHRRNLPHLSLAWVEGKKFRDIFWHSLEHSNGSGDLHVLVQQLLDEPLEVAGWQGRERWVHMLTRSQGDPDF